MAIIVGNIKLGLDENDEGAFKKALKKLGIKNQDIKEIGIYKASIDARKKDNIKRVVSVAIRLNEPKLEEKLMRARESQEVRLLAEEELIIEKGTQKLSSRPVVVGFGPAGMFCGLILARNGYAPIIIERGEKIEDRVSSVKSFWEREELNPNSNIQFGEGGAGSFSDGKLTTRINDKRCRAVLEELCHFGAPREILTKAKPHVGTDKLRGVVKGIREEIISLGGEISFCERLEDITIKNGAVASAVTNKREIRTENLILCPGHSARDTFFMLDRLGVFLEPKGFSIGFRIEHLQKDIDLALYGKDAIKKYHLPPAEYQLSKRTGDKGTYSFCMCPGGYVVEASSEENMVCTNGMSEFSRDGKNANSAILAEVKPYDFEDKSALGGVYLQRKIESLAYENGGKSYKAPCQDVGSFLEGKAGLKLGRIAPSIEAGTKSGDFSKLFPKESLAMLRDGISYFGRKIKGFDCKDAILTAPETRSSSPVRITRNENMESLSLRGLYPVGEGAGYAGGIMSAAVDGIKVAEKLCQKYAPIE